MFNLHVINFMDVNLLVCQPTDLRSCLQCFHTKQRYAHINSWQNGKKRKTYQKRIWYWLKGAEIKSNIFIWNVRISLSEWQRLSFAYCNNFYVFFSLSRFFFAVYFFRLIVYTLKIQCFWMKHLLAANATPESEDVLSHFDTQFSKRTWAMFVRRFFGDYEIMTFICLACVATVSRTWTGYSCQNGCVNTFSHEMCIRAHLKCCRIVWFHW